MYFVEIFDTNNCSVVDSVEIIVFDLPSPISSADTTICKSDSIQLITSGGLSYQWTPTFSLSNSINDTVIAFPIDSQQYLINVIDSNTCSMIDTINVNVYPIVPISISGDTSFCINDTVLISASGAVNYSWSPLNIIQQISIDTVNVFPQSNDTLILTTIDSNTCQKTDSIYLVVNNLPIITLVDSATLCIGDSIVVPVEGAINYIWDPSSEALMLTNDSVQFIPLDTGFIYVTASDSNGCVNSDSIFLLPFPLPNIGLASDTSTCTNDSVRIVATGVGTFEWSPTTGVDNPNQNDITVAPPVDSIEYQVLLTDSNSCKNAQSISVYSFGVSISNDTAICDAERFQFETVLIGGNEPITYAWNPTQNLSDPSNSEPFVDITNSTEFTLVATDATGCVDSAKSRLDVKINPEANFELTILPSCEGVLIEFENTSFNAFENTWYINQNDSSFVTDIERVFSYGDSVNIRLLVINSENCLDDTITKLGLKDFEEYMDLELANVFTPNFDGLNEWFELNISNDLHECTELHIFNRWGELLFISTGSNHSWNGRSFDGQEAPEGVYFYILKVADFQFNGHLQLIR